MSNPSSSSDSIEPPRPVRRRFRLSRLILKEMRETLRDRRTIVTLILMPLLVYPALSLVFKSFLLSQGPLLTATEPVVFHFAYQGNGDEQQTREAFRDFVRIVAQLKARDLAQQQQRNPSGNGDKDALNESDAVVPELPGLEFGQTGSAGIADFAQHQWGYVKPGEEVSLEQRVEASRADLGIVFIPGLGDNGEVGKMRLVARQDALSQTAAAYLKGWVARVNEADIERRLTLSGLPTGDAIAVTTETVGETDDSQQPGSFPLASIVPLILVLMTITGAVYPAIDLTAGERERGTLETLMAAPVPRFGILFSKFTAVVSVAMMTAILNIIGMFATVWAFQLDQHFGGGAFTLTVMLQMLLLLVLFAAFFSAILLVVTSFAKSFKEAQVYLIPVILLSLGPGLLTLSPGMKLEGINTVCPMINILLLARDVINNDAQLVPAIVAIISTLIYSVVAIRIAASIFGSDAILYADGGNLVEVLKSPSKVQTVVPFAATIFCLLMLVPLNFASVGYLTRLPSETAVDLQFRFMMMGFFLILTFLAFPSLVARHQNANFKTAFGLVAPKPLFWLAGLMLGVSLWPIVMWLTSAFHDLYGMVAGAEAAQQWHDQIVGLSQEYAKMFRQVSPLTIAICFSLIPAICEEWFFRGMLLRTLLKTQSPFRSVLYSALLFGAFHMISNSVIAFDRMVPTALVGMILGYLAYKSGSIWPGVVLHAIHNAFVSFLVYYQENLERQPWFPSDESVPWTWAIAGLVIALVALTLVWRQSTQSTPAAAASG